jgi:hypothetical protein
MEEKDFLETILGFSKPWQITEMEKTSDTVKIKLDFPKGTRFRCTKCGGFCTTYDTKLKAFRHTIKNHWNNILNYFDNRLTNAILEGINNIIQNIKHTARGFRNYDYFKTIVYLFCGAFTVSARVPTPTK